MAVFISGKTVVNLNFTANITALIAAIQQADIQTIYTSHRFVSKLQKKGIAIEQLLDQVTTYYLEDLHQETSTAAKIVTLVSTYILPARALQMIYGEATAINDTAAILFSSGSEGAPKGVMLSHQNIIGNIKQVSDVLDTRGDDIIVASLPLFHAFGLTITGLMPLIEGMPAICHPDPTDVVTIAKGISYHQATIFCGTSTFLRLFNKNTRIHPLMLDSLRITVAGAERLNPDVREQFSLKFGKTIYEGYGTTETTPVATVNIPDRIATDDWHIQTGQKIGTVGLPLPGSSTRIVDPNTLEALPTGEDGLILIGGTQVMQGYLNEQEKTQNAILTLTNRRWYKTGDKGHVDSDGFLTIVDRYSRFAKVGGEMISLGAIELTIDPYLPNDVDILATSIPDDKKGENIILLFAGDVDEEAMKQALSQAELPALARPTQLIQVEAIPKLGSGKSDFNQAKTIALNKLNLR